MRSAECFPPRTRLRRGAPAVPDDGTGAQVKSEIRRPKSEGNPKPEAPAPPAHLVWRHSASHSRQPRVCCNTDRTFLPLCRDRTTLPYALIGATANRTGLSPPGLRPSQGARAVTRSGGSLRAATAKVTFFSAFFVSGGHAILAFGFRISGLGFQERRWPTEHTPHLQQGRRRI